MYILNKFMCPGSTHSTSKRHKRGAPCACPLELLVNKFHGSVSRRKWESSSMVVSGSLNRWQVIYNHPIGSHWKVAGCADLFLWGPTSWCAYRGYLPCVETRLFGSRLVLFGTFGTGQMAGKAVFFFWGIRFLCLCRIVECSPPKKWVETQASSWNSTIFLAWKHGISWKQMFPHDHWRWSTSKFPQPYRILQ